MCLAQGPQRSDAGEARTHGPSVSSQALYHWATALPDDDPLESFNVFNLLPHNTVSWACADPEIFARQRFFFI